MKRITCRIMTSGLVAVAVILMSSGVAEARLSANHNETVLRDGR